MDEVFTGIWDRLGFNDMETMSREDYFRFINLSIDIALEDPDHWRLYFAIFTQPHVLNLFMDDLMQKSGPYLKLLYDYYEEQGYEEPLIQMRYAAAIIDGIQMHIMLDPENFPVEGVRKLLIENLMKN